ncbi:MAG: methylmalonyl Co-A mutase-associated GTPase MeaB, partial [Rhizobacter sp.]|nr:methylmalonyl Co-A mutase-associated GTPase MeaB [Rhizobacter sp.]
MAFTTYLLRCADGSYYCGHTDDMAVRLRQHEDGLIGYTAERKPFSVAWQGEFESRAEALQFELQVKGWSRAKKEALIAGDWKGIQRLAWGTRNPLPEHLRGETGPSIPQGERGGVSERTTGSVPPEPQLISPEPHPASAAPPTVRPEVSKDSEVHQPDMRGPSIPQGERSGVSEQGELGEQAGVSQPAALGEPAELYDRATIAAILRADRRALAKAITLLESTRPDHRVRADALLNALLPHTGNALRLGISGVPGVGKSTFIEALGLSLIDKGHKVAVLTIDPSSSVSGGSILGDKTRMEKLSVSDSAYIRPSPASGTLGGVAEKTREAMLVCEAAGYSVVIVETVGVGQSETAVAGMTDLFVLMQLPNAGDDLQAIKRGVMEL